TVAVPILGNLEDQPDKTFTLTLSAPSAASPGDVSAVGTILDDEAAVLPTASVDDPTVTEGDSDPVIIPFTISLSDFSDDEVTVSYRVTSPSGAIGTTQTLTFEPGDTEHVVTVQAPGNTTPGPDVTYTLTLTGATNAVVSATDGVGTGTVVDNDDDVAPNAVSVSDAAATEGDDTDTVLQFVVTLATPAAQAVSVDFATAGLTATPAEDFRSLAGTLDFAVGQDTKVVLVTVEGDHETESTEQLLFSLTAPSTGLEIADGQAVGTIIDDDPAGTSLTVAVGDGVVQEAATAAADFEVRLSSPAPAGGVVVNWSTVADTATAGDYTGGSGSVTIAAGTQTAIVSIPVVGDSVDEATTERFFLDITAPGAIDVVRSRGVGTIIDNEDLLPVVRIGDVTVHNGPTAGTVVVTVPVTLDRPSTVDITIEYTIPSPTGGAPITDTIVIPAGSTSGTGTTTVTGSLETVAAAPVALTDTIGAVIDPSDGADAPAVIPVVSLTGVQVTEGATEGTSIVTVTVTLDEVSEEDVTVVVTVPAAGPGGVAETITIVIPAGQTTGSGQVVVAGAPTQVAANPVEITSVTGGVESPTSGSLTPSVVDLPIVHIEDVVVNPGPTPGTTIVVVTVELDEPADTDVTVEFTVPPATPGGTPTVGTVVIPAGQTTGTGEVIVPGTVGSVGDSPVVLTDASGAVIDPGGSSSTPTPVDLPIVSIGDVSVTDSGTPGQVVVVIPVTLDEASLEPVTVTYSIPSTTGGAPTTGTITFPPGSTSETVQVTVPGTTGQVGGSTVTLTDATNAVLNPADLGDAAQVVDLPIVTIGDVTVSPGTTPGTVVVTIPVTLDQATNVPVTVDYSIPSTTGGSPTTGTITIPAGSTSGVGTVVVPGNTTTNVPGPVTLTDSTGSVVHVGDRTDAPSVVGSTTSGGTVTSGGTGSTGAAGAHSTPVDRFTKVATGYRMVASDGGIFTFGDAPFFGSTGDIKLNKPIVGMATTPSGDGYWLVATDGGIFTFGDAGFHGSTGDIKLNRPIVGMETTPSGNGYWLVADDGGIFAFGDAKFQGSTGDIKLNKPIVGMETTPSGNGYWLVATDGGIFAFGDAAFLGSTGDIRLNQPIVGMAASPSGDGYRLVATDGGIFTFGDAEFLGSTGDIRLNQPIVGMAASPTGAGYWLVATDGGVFTFGDSQFLGSTGDIRLNQPINGMAPVVRTVKAN
ncbi:MAG TPA: Calx-beta domain-containing protein, partial [Acidimicrobiales bacterium]|nr:Calx-beta domain-containing protein [Acidimicrobiales bacterium]